MFSNHILTPFCRLINLKLSTNILTILLLTVYSIHLNANHYVGILQVEGGTISTSDATVVCTSDDSQDIINFFVDGAEGPYSLWVVTDTNGTILATQGNGAIDFTNASPGDCIVYHMAFKTFIFPPLSGVNVNALVGWYALSNGITVTRLHDCDDHNNGDGNGDDCDLTIQGGVISGISNDRLYRTIIANRASGSVSVINTQTNEVISTLALPDAGEPTYVVHNDYNNTFLVGDFKGRVIAFDDQNFEITGSAEAGFGVFHMWLSPNRQQLWVNNIADRTISVINPNTMENITTINAPSDLGAFTQHDVIVSPDNSAAFVTFLGGDADDYVIKYNTSTFEEEARAAVGPDPHVSLTSVNDKLYVASQGSGEIAVLNRSDLSEVTVLNIPNAHGLGMNNAGTYLYVGNIAEGGMSATYTIDLLTNTLIGLPVDAPFSAPHNYAVSSDDSKLFITHSGASNDQVSVYSLSPTPTLIGTIGVGSNPFGLASYCTAERFNEIDICAGDQVSDAFDVGIHGASGPNAAWVITDLDLNILAVPPSPPFDLDGAGTGSCYIWHLSFEDGLTGAEVGDNAGDLDGCFDLSNPILVVREDCGPTGNDNTAPNTNGDAVGDACGVNSGTIVLCDGSGTNINVCTSDGVDSSFDVCVNDNEGGSFWVIIDADRNLIAQQDGNTFDFEGAPAGLCIICHVSYEGEIIGLESGMPVDDVEGCVDFSNEISVTRFVDDPAYCYGLNSISQELSFQTIGNPVNDQLRLQIQSDFSGQSRVIIYDIIGRTLFNNTIHVNRGQTNVEIETSEFDPGLHFIQLNNKQKSIMDTFIKEGN